MQINKILNNYFNLRFGFIFIEDENTNSYRVSVQAIMPISNLMEQ